MSIWSCFWELKYILHANIDCPSIVWMQNINRNYSDSSFVKWIIAYGGIILWRTITTCKNEYLFWGGQQERHGLSEGYIGLFNISLFIAFYKFLNASYYMATTDRIIGERLTGDRLFAILSGHLSARTKQNNKELQSG